ncbi:uncharacterized protein RHO17_003164 [Thomomys bottae]
MGKERKSKRSVFKRCGAPYQQTKIEVAQQVTEEKRKPLKPLVKLYDIMGKKEKKDEGASKIPGDSPEKMPAGECGCTFNIVKYTEGVDPVKDQKEAPTPETSEGEGTSKK